MLGFASVSLLSFASEDRWFSSLGEIINITKTESSFYEIEFT